MAEKQITELQELLDFAASHGTIVVDFYADWCGPCKRIAPYVHKTTQKLGIALAKVNVDNAEKVSTKYGITAMPTFQVLNSKGQKIFEKVGGSQAVVNQVVEYAQYHK